MASSAEKRQKPEKEGKVEKLSFVKRWLETLKELIRTKLFHAANEELFDKGDFFEKTKDTRKKLKQIKRDVDENKIKKEDGEQEIRGLLSQLREEIEERRRRYEQFQEERKKEEISKDEINEAGKLGDDQEKTARRVRYGERKIEVASDEDKEETAQEVEKKLEKTSKLARASEEIVEMDKKAEESFLEMEEDVDRLANEVGVSDEGMQSIHFRQLKTDFLKEEKKIRLGTTSEVDELRLEILKRKFIDLEEKGVLTEDQREYFFKRLQDLEQTKQRETIRQAQDRQGLMRGTIANERYSDLTAEQEARIINSLGSNASLEDISRALDMARRPVNREMINEFLQNSGASNVSALQERMMLEGRSLNYWYDNAVQKIREDYKEVLDPGEKIPREILEEYVESLMKRIVGSGEASYERSNSQIIYEWVALSTEPDLSDKFEGVVTFPSELKDRFEKWMGAHDFNVFALKAGGPEQYVQGAAKMDPEYWAQTLKERASYSVLFRVENDGEWGEMQEFDLQLITGHLVDLAETQYWSERLLHLSDEVREQAKKDMIEHVLATQSGQRTDKFNFSKYYGVSIKERMKVVEGLEDGASPTEGAIQILGMKNGRSNELLEGGTETFYNKAAWQWQFAEGYWHASMRSSKWAVLFGAKNYNIPDWMVKNIQTKGWFMNLGVSRRALWKHASTEYHDFMSEREGDLYSHVIDALAGQMRTPEMSRDEYGDLKSRVKQSFFLLMNNKDGFLMSPGEFLESEEKFNELVPRSKRDIGRFFRPGGRFAHLQGKERQRTKNLLQFAAELNWKDAAEKLAAIDNPQKALQIRDADPFAYQGRAGFRAFLQEVGVSRMAWTADQIKDLETYERAGEMYTNEYEKKAMWKARVMKYAEYFLGAAKTRGAFVGLDQTPTLDALGRFHGSGPYPHMSQEQYWRKMAELADETITLRLWQPEHTWYRTENNQAQLVRDSVGSPVLTSEGLPIHETYEIYAAVPGRTEGLRSDKVFVVEDKLDDMAAANMINIELKEDLKDEHIRSVPLLTDFLRNHPKWRTVFTGGDPFYWTKGTALEGLLYHKFRIGFPGPLLGWLRTNFSYVIWKDWARDVRDDVFASLGQTIGDAAQKA